MFVIEQQSVDGVGLPGLKEEQEELVPGWTGLKKAEQQLQQPTQLQHTTANNHYIVKVTGFGIFYVV